MIGLILSIMLSMSDKKAMEKIDFFYGKIKVESDSMVYFKNVLDNGYFNCLSTQVPFVAGNRTALKTIIDTSSNWITISNLNTLMFQLPLLTANKQFIKARIDTSKIRQKMYGDSVKAYLDSLVIN